MKLPKNKRKLVGLACAVFLLPIAVIVCLVTFTGKLIYSVGLYVDQLLCNWTDPLVKWVAKRELKEGGDREECK